MRKVQHDTVIIVQIVSLWRFRRQDTFADFSYYARVYYLCPISQKELHEHSLSNLRLLSSLFVDNLSTNTGRNCTRTINFTPLIVLLNF